MARENGNCNPQTEPGDFRTALLGSLTSGLICRVTKTTFWLIPSTRQQNCSDPSRYPAQDTITIPILESWCGSQVTYLRQIAFLWAHFPINILILSLITSLLNRANRASRIVLARIPCIGILNFLPSSRLLCNKAIVWMNEWSSQLYTQLRQLRKESLKKKIGLERDSNPWPLRCRCSALPTELSSQLGAGHIVNS